MQLATMLEPALLSPSPAPARLLSRIMTRLVRLLPPSNAGAADQPKAAVPDLASKLHMRLQEYINRCLTAQLLCVFSRTHPS
jgi:hypothetical protein